MRFPMVDKRKDGVIAKGQLFLAFFVLSGRLETVLDPVTASQAARVSPLDEHHCVAHVAWTATYAAAPVITTS